MPSPAHLSRQLQHAILAITIVAAPVAPAKASFVLASEPEQGRLMQAAGADLHGRRCLAGKSTLVRILGQPSDIGAAPSGRYVVRVLEGKCRGATATVAAAMLGRIEPLAADPDERCINLSGRTCPGPARLGHHAADLPRR